MLKINKLHKSYKMGDSSLHVLKGIDLNIEKGEMVAIMGSSGSGVFSTKGKYIGIVTAIDIGQTEFGVDILENVVLVTPVFKVDWSVILD